MSNNIVEENPAQQSDAPSGPQGQGAGGGQDKIRKQARQLAYDVRYKVKQSFKDGQKTDPASLKRAFVTQLGKSPAPGPVKLLAKKMLIGEEYDFVDISETVENVVSNTVKKIFAKTIVIDDVDGNPAFEVTDLVQEDSTERKYKIRVTDKKTGKSYVRMANRPKISELRSNPNISSVEMTGYGTPYEGEKKKGSSTAAVKSGKGLAKKDYDGDGKLESPTAEYKGSKDKAIKKAVAKEEVEVVDEKISASGYARAKKYREDQAREKNRRENPQQAAFFREVDTIKAAKAKRKAKAAKNLASNMKKEDMDTFIDNVVQEDIADIIARLEKKRISKGGDPKDSPLPAMKKYHAKKKKVKKGDWIGPPPKKQETKEEVVQEADSLAAQTARWEANRQRRMKKSGSYERPNWIPRDQDHEDRYGSSKGEKKKVKTEEVNPSVQSALDSLNLLDERLGGKGYKSYTSLTGKKVSGDWEDSDRGAGNKAKKRAGGKVEKKSPTYQAYVLNKEHHQKDATGKVIEHGDGTPSSVEEAKKKGLDGKECWDGYKLAGTKKKGGKTVDNCVKVKEDFIGEVKDVESTDTIGKKIDVMKGKNKITINPNQSEQFNSVKDKIRSILDERSGKNTSKMVEDAEYGYDKEGKSLNPKDKDPKTGETDDKPLGSVEFDGGAVIKPIGDSREMPTAFNLIKNKLRARGMKL